MFDGVSNVSLTGKIAHFELGCIPESAEELKGAAGFLITDGEVGPAVAEITIASNLKQMFATLEPATDLKFRRGIDSPTLLVPEMTVASA